MTSLSIRHMRLVLALVVAWSANAGADTYPRQAGVDARHYVFRVTLLTGDSNEIQGEATATFRLLASNLGELALDLATPRADGKGMTVTSVTSKAASVAFTHRDNRLRLVLPSGLTAGQEVTFTISSSTRRGPGRCTCCASRSAPRPSGEAFATTTDATSTPRPRPTTFARSWNRRPARPAHGSRGTRVSSPSSVMAAAISCGVLASDAVKFSMPSFVTTTVSSILT